MSGKLNIVMLVIGMLAIENVRANNTFDVAYQAMLEHNPEYQAALYQYQSHQQVVSQARAQLLPQLTIQASSSIVYEETTIQDDNILQSQESSAFIERSSETPRLGGFAFEGDSVPEVDNYTSESASINLTQSIIDAEKWLGFKQAKSQSQEAQYQLASVHESLFVKLVDALFALAKVNQRIALTQQELEAVKKQKELTSVKYDERLGNLTDVHESTARYLTLLAEQQALLAQKQQAGANLIEMVGEGVFDSMDFSLNLDVAKVTAWLDGKAAPELFDEAYKNNAKVNLAIQKLRSADLAYAQKRVASLPKLNLKAQSSIEKTSRSVFTDEEDNRKNQVLLTLNVPIFSGFNARSKTKQAYYAYQAAEKQLEVQHIELDKLVNTTLLNLHSNKLRVELLEQAQANTADALELRRLGYQEGVSSNLSYLESLSISFAGQRNYIDAQYDYVLGLIKALATIQTLNTTTINEVNSLFTIEQSDVRK